MEKRSPVQIQVKMDLHPDLSEALESRMAIEGWNKNELVRRALEAYLKEEVDFIKSKR